MADNRFADWDQEELEILEVPVEDPTPVEALPESRDDTSVIYEDDRVIAFFDADWNSTQQVNAIYAKVWDRDEQGAFRVSIIELD